MTTPTPLDTAVEYAYQQGIKHGQEVARCCQGCPDCVGIGVREHLLAVKRGADLLRSAMAEIDKADGHVSASAWGTLLAAAEDLL